MSDVSPRLKLPLIAPSQALKHVTHNEALLRLDAITQLSVEALGVTTPPNPPLRGPAMDWGLLHRASGLALTATLRCFSTPTGSS